MLPGNLMMCPGAQLPLLRSQEAGNNYCFVPFIAEGFMHPKGQLALSSEDKAITDVKGKEV